MSVTYTATLKNTRLNAVTTAIGASGFIQIGTAGMASILATIPLAATAAPAASGGVLTFTMPQSDNSADATSPAAAEARIVTSALATVASGLTVGISGSGADVILDSVSITAGQTVTLNSAAITHG
ncbi:MAG: hypothetical protein JKX87_06280 [Cycloclasticus sp.]|nr:hypothetical protein [Cycloclasticus sp.]